MPTVEDHELTETDISENIEKFRRMFSKPKPIDKITTVSDDGSLSQMAEKGGVKVHAGGWAAFYVEDVVQRLANEGTNAEALERWLLNPEFEVHHIAHVRWTPDDKIIEAQFDRFVPTPRAVRESALPAVRAEDIEMKLKVTRLNTADPRPHRNTVVTLELIHKGERLIDRELVGEEIFKGLMA